MASGVLDRLMHKYTHKMNDRMFDEKNTEEDAVLALLLIAHSLDRIQNGITVLVANNLRYPKEEK